MAVSTETTLATILLQWPYTDKLVTTGIANLEELVDNLRTRKYAKRHFNFAAFNMHPQADNNHCGTSGCAIGEMPLLRPDAFHFHSQIPPERRAAYSLVHFDPELRPDLFAQAEDWLEAATGNRRVRYANRPALSAMYWFQITQAMFDHLFIPLEQHDDYDYDRSPEEQLDLKEMDLYGGSYFLQDATPDDVADNIVSFIQEVNYTWNEIQDEWKSIYVKPLNKTEDA
jgi:hypothetical protein